MKNISLILNIVLLIAVAYLFIDKFSTPKGAAGKLEAMAQQDAGHPLKIMTINLDSLHAKSETFQAKKTELEKRQADAETALKAKGRIFDKELAAYQQRLQSGNITPKEAQEIEKSLGQKQQSFQAEQERLANEIMAETDKFNAEFTTNVRNYLDSLKQDLGYDYILVTGSGSPVLVSNEQMDITQSILELLNKKN
ncbi:MAG: OmpH family outer membrane protein [Saprospiraceae bacterium]|nr:MAG: OmpH family outer membrane protein [Saprospiraceae bacterium]